MNSPLPTILFENDDLLVINKPAGLVVHPAFAPRSSELQRGEPERTLVDWILETYPEITGVGEPMRIQYKGKELVIDRPGIVHRLDRETSGVMIIVKNQHAYEFLKKQFQDHSIQKEYLAILSGWTEDRGTIDAPIGRHPKDIRVWTTGRGVRGMVRPAITRYIALKKFADTDGNKYTLVQLFPETGRTHQLRVHMKSIQRPIIGDGLYAPNTLGQLGFNRVALHAQRITFVDLENKQHTVEASIPDDFTRLFLT